MTNGILSNVGYLKGAYGFENFGRCAYNTQQPATYKSINEVIKKSREEGTQHVALYITKTAKKWRTEKGFPEISRWIGTIAAIQEIPPVPTPYYNKEWGFDRWDAGIPSGRIFVFKEPCLLLRDFSVEIQQWITATALSSAIKPIPQDKAALKEAIHAAVSSHEMLELEEQPLPEGY